MWQKKTLLIGHWIVATALAWLTLGGVLCRAAEGEESNMTRQQLVEARKLALDFILRLQIREMDCPDVLGFWDAYHPIPRDDKPYPWGAAHGIVKYGQPYEEVTGFTLETLAESSDLPGGRRYLDAAAECVGYFIERLQFGEKYHPKARGALARFVGADKATSFTSGECIRGILAVYRRTKAPAHLKLAEDIARWGMTNCINSDGSVMEDVHVVTGEMNKGTFVYNGRPWGWGLLELWRETGKEEYRNAGQKVLRWVLVQQRPNGSFNNSLNIPEYNTYAAEGLYFGGKILDDREMVAAAERFLDTSIKAPHHPVGFLYAAYNSDWASSPQATTSVEPTAVYQGFWSCDAQHARLCYNFYRDTKDERYLKEGDRILRMLLKVQVRESNDPMTIGALPHGYGTTWWHVRLPIWTAKYFVDCISLRLTL